MDTLWDWLGKPQIGNLATLAPVVYGIFVAIKKTAAMISKMLVHWRPKGSPNNASDNPITYKPQNTSFKYSGWWIVFAVALFAVMLVVSKEVNALTLLALFAAFFFIITSTVTWVFRLILDRILEPLNNRKE